MDDERRVASDQCMDNEAELASAVKMDNEIWVASEINVDNGETVASDSALANEGEVASEKTLDNEPQLASKARLDYDGGMASDQIMDNERMATKMNDDRLVVNDEVFHEMTEPKNMQLGDEVESEESEHMHTLNDEHKMAPVSDPALNQAVHLQAILERARVGAGHIQRATASTWLGGFTETVAKALEGYEIQAEKFMAERVKEHPTWPWLKSVKGIGAQTASLLLAYLLPPREDKGVSSWFKVAGLYPVTVDGVSHLPRFKKGETITYLPQLRRNLYIVGESLIRQQDFYYDRYIEFKKGLAAQHVGIEAAEYKRREKAGTLDGEWRAIRVERVARVKMLKLFLSHLYEAWAEAMGITVPLPYILAQWPRHTKIERP